MIGPEELAKLQGYMDDAFAFKIGDTVQAKALGDFVEKPSGHGVATDKRHDPSSWYHISFSGQSNLRYQIVERMLQQCHGGVQKHYKVSTIDSHGLIESGTRMITEPELTLSRPYRELRSTSKKELQAFVDGLPDDSETSD